MHISIDASIIASVDVSSASIRASPKASADDSGQIWWLLARCDSQDPSVHDSTSVGVISNKDSYVIDYLGDMLDHPTSSSSYHHRHYSHLYSLSPGPSNPSI